MHTMIDVIFIPDYVMENNFQNGKTFDSARPDKAMKRWDIRQLHNQRGTLAKSLGASFYYIALP